MSKSENSNLHTLIDELFHNGNLLNKYIKFAEEQLTKYTRNKFARHVTPEGIVHDVAEKLMVGKFIWNKEKFTLNTIIYFRIRSEIQNLVKKEIHCIPVSLENYENNNEDFDENIDREFDEKLVEHGKNRILPRNYILDPFENEYDVNCISLLKVKEDAFEALKDSPLEFKVAEKLFQYIKPGDIALSLDLPTSEVHNITRRIFRLIRSLYKSKNKKNNFTVKNNEGGPNVYIN